MCATFTDDDVGKPVENERGEEVGVVASVEGDVAHVRPSVDAVDSIKSSIGWEGVADETRPLDGSAVREITDDAVRLEGEFSIANSETDPEATDSGREGDDGDGPVTESAGGSAGLEETDVAADPRDETDEEPIDEVDAIDDGEGTRGLEADATELIDEGREIGTRTDAAMEATDDPRRTDAAIDPGEQPRRTDPEVDPDAVRDQPTDGGPTTEDARRSEFEDGEGPERERRTELEDGSDDELERDERERTDGEQ